MLLLNLLIVTEKVTALLFQGVTLLVAEFLVLKNLLFFLDRIICSATLERSFMLH